MTAKYLRVFAVALALAAGTGAALAQDKPEFTLKIGTIAPKGTPWAELLKRYEKRVEKLSGGRINVIVYLAGRKGDEQSLVRQVYRGDLELCGVSTGAMSGMVPDVDILELPYLFDSAEQADRILDGPARPILEQMLEEKGFKLLMYSENGYRNFGTKGGFVKTPADLLAKKMRSQESPVHVEMYRALGASPVTISVGEVLSALQTGVVDGFDNTPLYTFAASWYQAIDHYTVTKHIYQPALLVINKDWFERLPADLQKILFAPAAKLQRKGRMGIRAMEPGLLENFGIAKIKVYYLTDEEKQAFKDATRPVWDIRRKSASKLGVALLDAILEAKRAEGE